MPKLEVFFDYACPFCRKGHQNLIELLPQYPGISVAWRPCESHPRPDAYGIHSDLCIQGMFFAADQGIDLLPYHARMFDLIHRDRADVGNLDVLSARVADLLDEAAFHQALAAGKYARALAEANDYAYVQSGVWAVPAYRMEGRRLDAVENIGVTKEDLRAFLEESDSAHARTH